MSSLKVEIVTLDRIESHPNADRLEIGFVKSWAVVIPKGQFKLDTLCVYFPIDSILPESLEAKLFPPESKVKLHHHRVKTVKLRGVISQGLLARLDELDHDYSLELMNNAYIGKDIADLLGITKYEPPKPIGGKFVGRQKSKRQTNPQFHKYTDIESWKWFPNLFTPGEMVFVTEKLHGSSFRCGYVPYHAGTWWKRLLKFIHLAPKYEFVFGSHNVQFQDTPRKKGYYGNLIGNGKSVYAEAVEKYDLRNKLKFGEVIYAEIYGDGIQKGYLYSCKPGERKIAVIDWQQDGKYLTHDIVINRCHERSLSIVPLDGYFGYDEARVRKLVDAPSWLGSELREGVVIKPAIEEHCLIGRKILKFKSDKFLLLNSDDSH